MLITSLGTEIHYTARLVPDDYWNDHVDHLWNPRAVRRALARGAGTHTRSARASRAVSRFPITTTPRSRRRSRRSDDPAAHPGADASTSSTPSASSSMSSRSARARARRCAMSPTVSASRSSISWWPAAPVPTRTCCAATRWRWSSPTAITRNSRSSPSTRNIYFAQQAHALGILEAVEHYDFFSCLPRPADAGR